MMGAQGLPSLQSIVPSAPSPDDSLQLKTRCSCGVMLQSGQGLTVEETRVPWSCEDSFCTPLFIHEMRKIFKRAKLLAETYPGIKVTTHIMAPCGSLYCVRGSAERAEHHRGPKLGISRRLRQIAKDAKCMLELFPKARISIQASAVANNAPFDFNYSNFLSHEASTLGIVCHSPPPTPNSSWTFPKDPQHAAGPPRSDKSVIPNEPHSGNLTMMMRFGSESRVRRKRQWWLETDQAQDDRQSSLSEMPIGTMLGAVHPGVHPDPPPFCNGNYHPNVRGLADLGPFARQLDLSPSDALSDVSTASVMSDATASAVSDDLVLTALEAVQRRSRPPPSKLRRKRGDRKDESGLEKGRNLPLVENLTPAEHVNLLLGLKT